MAWTAEDRRKYAPAIQEVLRQGMLVRLAATIDTIYPPPKTGRPRDWSTVTMLGALWHLARDGCAWRRLPVGPGLPPHQSVWSRLLRWRLRAVLDRALGPCPSAWCRSAGPQLGSELPPAATAGSGGE
jgi:hypothetical protein